MTEFRLLHPQATAEHLGLWPNIFKASDPRPARDQINDRYDYGGGWRPMRGFELTKHAELCYPGDPALEPFATCYLPLSKETLLFYPHAQVVILQADSSFEAGRMD